MSASYSTPEYTHCIRDARFRRSVYEPEADTFLFLEALDKDTDLLRQLSPSRCIEIGCGSGTVITHLRCRLMPSSSGANAEGAEEEQPSERHSTAAASTVVGGPLFCAVDVNPLALEATGITWTETLRKHFTSAVLADHFSRLFHTDVPTLLAAPVVAVASSGNQSVEEEREASNSPSPSVSTPFPRRVATATSVGRTSSGISNVLLSTYCLRRFQGDLFDPVRRSLGEKDAVFDVILFNPPYVPTSLEELEEAIAQKDVITAAWCGGPRGRVVLDRFVRQLPAAMSRRGTCYLVLVTENEVADVMDFAQRAFRAYLEQTGVAVPEGDVLETVEVAARYTGEHLSVHRLRYVSPLRDAVPPPL
ncbi:putative eRF1 methyltransferase catalytic subunit [Leptomonas pyrrhocoris]|uniref:Putative eRF1 methyltransferase catalytic subunit n=1 Tax=Leptomonas pyrrhocoris TaxID=157538 RepID=A0A0M9G8P1_LEPPY|nr:putative eRF1 methyltransferase catalytic subunit [Leptomonas pyrrhocoris]XP_015663225.1 putative eRF1 methyltransferase catalytic subunit [Leptomonas pyrrhocoris]KPA84785.1 putative eRF1 methyltransferase catalytic subunit [Leptomonas pyrrhocoris]KPA84786.1 putative eRF1 methyltransferase catalytic subunit [Leptomonas pyrrhocoris]|eukprot:XP_015663224.1 putative eRF1 methyltransferase catalytic subunit [Leptomonas pyrrhocoris]